jgi:hypothetical protein
MRPYSGIRPRLSLRTGLGHRDGEPGATDIERHVSHRSFLEGAWVNQREVWLFPGEQNF